MKKNFFQFGGIINDSKHFKGHKPSAEFIEGSYKLTGKAEFQYKRCIDKYKRKNSYCKFKNQVKFNMKDLNINS